MPAGARELFAEGLVIPPVRLTPEVERLVLANVRTPAMRRGDLAAQRAAVERGADGLRALVDRYGWAGVQRAARDLMDYAERRTRAALGRYTVPGLSATDWMEGDGVTDADLAITVRVDIKDGTFHADFTGTAPAAEGNVNCPLAVTRSAVLFVVRTLLEHDVPMNGGVQRAVRVSAPEGCLVNARWPSAVAIWIAVTGFRPWLMACRTTRSIWPSCTSVPEWLSSVHRMKLRGSMPPSVTALICAATSYHAEPSLSIAFMPWRTRAIASSARVPS